MAAIACREGKATRSPTATKTFPPQPVQLPPKPGGAPTSQKIAVLVFFPGQAEFGERSGEGGSGAVQAQAVTQLVQRQVGLLRQDLAQFVVAVGRHGGGAAARVGPGAQGAGFRAQPHIVADAVGRNLEQACESGARGQAAVERVNDPRAEFNGVSFHGEASSRDNRRWNA